MLPLNGPRKKLVQEALAEKAPKLYKELKDSGELPKFLDRQSQLMHRMYWDRVWQKTEELDKLEMPFLERIQTLSTEQLLAAEQAIRVFTDFEE